MRNSCGVPPSGVAENRRSPILVMGSSALGHRADVEDRTGSHRRFRLDVRHTKALGEDDPVAADDGHRHSRRAGGSKLIANCLFERFEAGG